MSLIIHGMNMPRGKPILVQINTDGKVWELYWDGGAYQASVYRVEELPPHGRLIDAEQPTKEIEDAIENIDRDFSLLDFNSRYCMERGLRMAKTFLGTASTIIEAEG